MGQDISREICAKIPQRIKDDLRYVQVELKRDLSHFSREAVAVKDVALISHSEIREMIATLNSILRNCCVDGNERVLFGLRSNEANLLWKAFLKIYCFKINVDDETARVARILNLHQFWKLRASLLCEIQLKCNLISDGFEIVNHSDVEDEESVNVISQHDLVDFPEKFTVSAVLKRVTEVSVNTDECQICMDNKVEVSLKCAHSFCANCISKWNQGAHSCPTCRELIFSADEFWEFIDIPSTNEMNKHLVSLATGS